MAFYADFLAEIKAAMKAKRGEAWLNAKIETRSGMQTQYVSLNYDLRAFIQWLEGEASMEALDDVQQGSMLFIQGGE